MGVPILWVSMERLEAVPDGWKGDELIGPVERDGMIARAKEVLGEK